MQIPEDDRYWQKEEVNRISDVVAEKFNKFAHEHPAKKQKESDDLFFAVPFLGSLEEEIQERAIPDK